MKPDSTILRKSATRGLTIDQAGAVGSLQVFLKRVLTQGRKGA
jgi:hypothetical protein